MGRRRGDGHDEQHGDGDAAHDPHSRGPRCPTR
jgi:hypothetical protein